MEFIKKDNILKEVKINSLLSKNILLNKNHNNSAHIKKIKYEKIK